LEMGSWLGVEDGESAETFMRVPLTGEYRVADFVLLGSFLSFAFPDESFFRTLAVFVQDFDFARAIGQQLSRLHNPRLELAHPHLLRELGVLCRFQVAREPA